MNKPTILFVSNSSDFYGSEKILYSIIKDLHEYYHVHITIPSDGPLVAKIAELDGVKIYTLTLLRFTKRPIDLFYNLMMIIPFGWGLLSLLRRISPDVVYCNTIRNLVTAAIVHWAGYPVIFHAHERNQAGLPGKAFARIAAYSVDMCCFISEYVARSYIEVAPFLPQRYRVIYNGTDIFAPPVSPLSRQKFFPSLITVAQLAPHKRIDDLLRAMPLVLRRYPHARLVILGEGSDRKRLENLINELSLAGCVELAGYELNVSQRLAAADIFLAPFESEGLNMATIEAMVCKKPVVAAASGGLLESVKEGESGLFYDLGDYRQLAERIVSLAESSECRQFMGENGRQRAELMFNPHRQHEKIREIIDELVNGRIKLAKVAAK